MRKAILDGIKVVGFEQVKEELKPEAKKAKDHQVDVVMKKYGFKEKQGLTINPFHATITIVKQKKEGTKNDNFFR